MKASPGGIVVGAAGDGTGGRISVDLAGLKDLAAVVRRDNDAALRPGRDRLGQQFSSGVCFGARSASGAVYEAKVRYHANLRRANDLLAAYVQAAEVLADAAERVATNYRRTDALSAATVADVEKALAQALAAARTTVPFIGPVAPQANDGTQP